MKNRSITYLLLFGICSMLAIMQSCQKTDDLEADINSLKDRVAALEKATEGLNTSFASLQALMQKNKIIIGITPTKDGLGYLLELSDGTSIKVMERQIILTPGQRAELNKNNGRLTVKQVDAKLDAVWHDNLIPFQKADIFTITKALERFYDVKIILSPDIQTGKTYSGVLKRKSNIESVLKSLQNSIPIDYKIVGNNIFISPK